MKDDSSNYKYALQFLSEEVLPIDISERQFTALLSIPWSTYQKDKHALKTDKFSMPESRLFKYAKAFGVRMEDLLNYTIEQQCVISKESRHKTITMQTVIEEFGLSR